MPGTNGQIAFQADTGSGNQIYTVSPNGQHLRQITHVNGMPSARIGHPTVAISFSQSILPTPRASR